MLNEEKVKSMTKAAAYEKGPEKKNIEIGSYFRGDYLGLHMVKSALAYTLAFLIIGHPNYLILGILSLTSLLYSIFTILI